MITTVMLLNIESISFFIILLKRVFIISSFWSESLIVFVSRFILYNCNCGEVIKILNYFFVLMNKFVDFTCHITKNDYICKKIILMVPLPMVQNVDNRKFNRSTYPLEVSADFVVHERIGRDLMEYYGRFPCKIEACCLCYVIKGKLKATINLGEFDIAANDFVVLLPGAFLQIKEISDDTFISFEGYSSSFLKKINFWKIISPIMQHAIKNPVFSLNEDMGNFYRESFSIMTKAASFGSSFMTSSIAESSLIVAIDMLAGAISNDLVKGATLKNSSRDQTIVGEFMQLAMENYRKEHKISFYARKASLTLSHFCYVISKTTGMTAQQIIMNLIIMDAKTQLKGTDAAVQDIAFTLGFTSPTTFNRYFKNYTGMTPQEYRNSND